MGRGFLLASNDDAIGMGARDLTQFVTSMHELVGADGKDEAIGSAVRLCGVQFDAPAAAWVSLPGDHLWVLSASYGFDTTSKPALESELGLITAGDDHGLDINHVRDFFTKLSDSGGAMVLNSGDVLILVASDDPDPEPPLGLGPLLARTFDLVEESTLSRLRSENLEMSLALTAHELRSPLLSVKAAIETSLAEAELETDDEDHNGDFTAALLNRANREISQIAGLCDSLLFWAADQNVDEFGVVDIVEAVDGAVRGCGHERNYDRISFVAPTDPIDVVGNIEHLRIAVSNLIRNALYFSPPDEEVTVSLRRHEGVVRITVTDRGPGVPRSQLKSIFDPFVRGFGEKAPRNGRGLGLFIAKRVVEGHRGRIWIDSRQRGARFIIELPLARERT